MIKLKSTDDLQNLLACLDSNYGDDSANQAEAADVIRELLSIIELAEPEADSHNPRDLQEIRFLGDLVESEYGKNFRQWWYWVGGDDGYVAKRDERDETAALEYPPLNRQAEPTGTHWTECVHCPHIGKMLVNADDTPARIEKLLP